LNAQPLFFPSLSFSSFPISTSCRMAAIHRGHSFFLFSFGREAVRSRTIRKGFCAFCTPSFFFPAKQISKNKAVFFSFFFPPPFPPRGSHFGKTGPGLPLLLSRFYDWQQKKSLFFPPFFFFQNKAGRKPESTARTLWFLSLFFFPRVARFRERRAAFFFSPFSPCGSNLYRRAIGLCVSLFPSFFFLPFFLSGLGGDSFVWTFSCCSEKKKFPAAITWFFSPFFFPFQGTQTRVFRKTRSLSFFLSLL